MEWKMSILKRKQEQKIEKATAVTTDMRENRQQANTKSREEN